MTPARFAAIVCVSALAGAGTSAAQSFASRGFADGRLFLYPQPTPNDPTRAVGEALVRYEPSWRPRAWLRFNGGLDARLDTHDQVERRWFIDWEDRGVQRPPFSVRRFSAVVSRAGLSIEAGKQFIRWGKADVLNPTDRFAPRDFLSVVDNDFLAVLGARAIYEAGGNTLDAVWVPHFTPSRIPLLNQRWSVVPALAVPIVDTGSRFPRGSQAGVRFNRTGAGYEFSVSFYNGFNHLPLVAATLAAGPPHVDLSRVYPQMRMYGGDFALPNKWVTIKGEVAYFTSTTAAADEYGIYVVQLERQVREWTLVGGYAGDFVTRVGVAPALPALSTGAVLPAPPAAGPTLTTIPAARPVEVPFAAERGLARAFLGRASVTLGVNDTFSLQAAVRQNGDGTWLQAQYSRAVGGHVRATIEGNLLRGADTDFIGQFRHNSNANLSLRYSF